jgi:hypothetical protein
VESKRSDPVEDASMRVDRFRNKGDNEFFVAEIHRLPTDGESHEETVNLFSARAREYFETYEGALRRSKTLVKEAERRGERTLCLIYRQTLVATVVESDRRHLRIVK